MRDASLDMTSPIVSAGTKPLDGRGYFFGTAWILFLGPGHPNVGKNVGIQFRTRTQPVIYQHDVEKKAYSNYNICPVLGGSRILFLLFGWA